MGKVTRYLAIIAAVFFFFSVAADDVMAMGGLGRGGGSHGGGGGAPEIDPGMASSAIALLSCGLLILTSSHRRKK